MIVVNLLHKVAKLKNYCHRHTKLQTAIPHAKLAPCIPTMAKFYARHSYLCRTSRVAYAVLMHNLTHTARKVF